MPTRARACSSIDLDNFKSINDSLGHGFGDEVLEALGNRLLEFVRTTDTVSRIGGDEFVILLEDMNSHKEAERFAERILGKIRMPMEIRGQQLMPSVSIGLTMVEDPNESVEMLLGDADIAMYAAKERGKGRVVAFETTMRTRAAKRLETEAALRRAIEQDELYLVYQPIFGIGRGGAKAVGVEALLRWENGDRQDIAPSDLLSLAEENGMIEDIGRWVIHTVAQQLSHWRRQGFPEDFYANINLSSVHFESDEILSEILGALDPLGVPRNSLRVEVVETAVIQHPEKALSVIKLLQSQGILVSIDDFGTGYSSLSYLHRFPFHALKVDRSFVSDIAESRPTRDIITAIVMMARRLDIRVVAEGIESQAQLNFLRSIGCDMAQGFLLAMPEDPAAIARHFNVSATAAPGDDVAVPETVTVGNVSA
ncbi:MAG: EAL domain-containing protein [Gammaproteobacteria bacterium]|nr:EAL domain-containing protein [Gammaproteobacteria bacterium]